ncbi:MAG: 3-hydroxyacyl-CoA dehydrogenase NAD-binding domain-containing protein [Intestinimonas sp.]|nr:3-hydroxyacyl-CoA dehydrogenase NAD-binding domain-containing protein [Intestinimonas sp.]
MSDWNVLMVGAGTMGRGIAEVFAAKGIEITLYDAFPEQLKKAKEMIQADMKYYEQEHIVSPEEVKNTEKFISYEENLDKACSKINLVIEAVFEDKDIKRDTFNKLDSLCAPDCIFCSNTSASNIFEIAQIRNPERLLITHFFNPPYVMPLIELVMGPKTSTAVVEKVKDLLTSLGKEPAVIKRYIPGFIVNRLDNVLCREIGYMITQGWTTAEDVERAIRYTSGTRYSFEGPLSLHDVVGWDLTTTVSKNIYQTLCNDTDCDRLGTELIKEGRLGIKTQKGCYDYKGINTQEFMNKRSHKIIKMLKAIRTLDDPE